MLSLRSAALSLALLASSLSFAANNTLSGRWSSCLDLTDDESGKLSVLMTWDCSTESCQMEQRLFALADCRGEEEGAGFVPQKYAIGAGSDESGYELDFLPDAFIGEEAQYLKMRIKGEQLYIAFPSVDEDCGQSAATRCTSFSDLALSRR